MQHEVGRLEALGVHIECNVVIGRTYTLDELREQFDAVFVSVGAGLPLFLGVPGEGFKGVYSANEYLTRVNLMQAYALPDSDTPVLHGDRVVVIGGGNVAVDAVRTARRLGADRASIVYRRSRAEMPARDEEIHHAEEEGVAFEFLVRPLAIEGNEDRWVTGSALCRHPARRARRVGSADTHSDRGLGARDPAATPSSSPWAPAPIRS